MVISFLGKLPHIISYFQICSISFFGNVFTLYLVYIPAGEVFCLLVLFPHLQWLQQHQEEILSLLKEKIDVGVYEPVVFIPFKMVLCSEKEWRFENCTWPTATKQCLSHGLRSSSNLGWIYRVFCRKGCLFYARYVLGILHQDSRPQKQRYDYFPDTFRRTLGCIPLYGIYKFPCWIPGIYPSCS